MAAMSDYLEEAILNHILRGVPYSPPSSVYIALFTDDPNDAGGGPEVTDSGNQRQVITFSQPQADAEGYSATNDDDVSFPAVIDGEVTISHLALFDSQSGGNLLFHGSFDAPRTFQVGDEPVVRADSTSISIE